MTLLKEHLTKLVEKSLPGNLFNLLLNLTLYVLISGLVMSVFLILLIEALTK